MRPESRQWPIVSGASIPSSRVLPTGCKTSRRSFPCRGRSRLVRQWACDGLLLIGDAAHTMSPAGAIGVNVALATAAVAAQVILPRLGQGTIPRSALAEVQRVREEDVRTLHRVQRGVAAVLAPGRRHAAHALVARGPGPADRPLAIALADPATHLFHRAAAAARPRVQPSGIDLHGGPGTCPQALRARRPRRSRGAPRSSGS